MLVRGDVRCDAVRDILGRQPNRGARYATRNERGCNAALVTEGRRRSARAARRSGVPSISTTRQPPPPRIAELRNCARARLRAGIYGTHHARRPTTACKRRIPTHQENSFLCVLESRVSSQCCSLYLYSNQYRMTYISTREPQGSNNESEPRTKKSTSPYTLQQLARCTSSMYIFVRYG